jgi:hypothetical protein
MAPQEAPGMCIFRLASLVIRQAGVVVISEHYGEPSLDMLRYNFKLDASHCSGPHHLLLDGPRR